MNPANRATIGERELAELNARAEATLTYDDEAWDDVIQAAEDDCTSLCESLLAGAGDDRE